MFEIASALIFGLWFILTVLNQYRRGMLIGRIKRHDPFGLIPTWTFFAPRPGTTDHNVLYRDRLSDGSYSPWREVLPPGTGMIRLLWNPAKRSRKAVGDSCQQVVRLIGRRIGKRLLTQVPYLTLLNYVCQQPGAELAEARQFAIVRTYGYRPKSPEILMISNLHQLD